MIINSHIQMLKNKKNNKRKTSKSRNKRIISVYSSQNLVGEPLSKAASLPLKKANKASLANLNTRPKEPSRKEKSKPATLPMKSRPTENYEKIPMHFVNSNTNSEIEFSNYGETRKDGGKHFKKTLYIDCDQEALIKEIWRQDKRKDNLQQKAATKIQKVFRGYLTRKLLMKYVEEYEEKLLRERHLLERQMRGRRQREDYGSSRKDSFSHKPAESHYEWRSHEKENPLDMQSSIMAASVDIGNSIQEELHNESNTYDRHEAEAERETLTLNESLLARQQEISMSFGQENQHSPHFLQVGKRRNSKEISRSPNEEERKPHYISEDRTGDGFSQNISSCPSYSKALRQEKEEGSRISSMMKEEPLEQVSDRQSIHLQNLRSIEKAKWQQVIELVHEQMKEGINQEKTKELMSYILEFSVKNREELNHQSYQVTPTTITYRQEDLEHAGNANNEKPISFKKKPNKSQEVERLGKNQNLPCKLREDKSILERTSNMKEYFLKNLTTQDQKLDKLMSLREAVLRRKESNSLIELNNLLENNELTQDDFLQRMSTLTSRFLKQKKDIEETKDEIYQGYRAQLQLFKNTILDAKYLGYHIPFCRSMEIYPNHPKWRFDEVMIDELNQLASRRIHTGYPLEKEGIYSIPELSTRKIDQLLQDNEAFKQEQDREVFNDSQSEDNSVNFSYEETNIYNEDLREPPASELVLSPKNMRKINSFNRYSTISLVEDFEFTGREEKRLNNSEEKAANLEEEEEDEYVSLKRMPKKETFKIEYSSDEEEEVALYQESNDKQIEELVSHCTNKLVYDFLEDLFKTTRLVEGFNLPRSSQRRHMQPITKQEKLSFLETTVAILPTLAEIQERLNQKMYPNTKELLVSMREEVEGTDSEHEYYEIGHYEYILNQQICYESIENFIEGYLEKARSKVQKEAIISNEHILLAELATFSSPKLKQYVQIYSESARKKEEEGEELRGEVLKIELHLVLDAWNEYLIKYRENKLGYSGIGLNEITYSLIDRVCRPITRQQEWKQMIQSTKNQLERVIKSDLLHEKLMKEYEEFVSDNDSQWILYAQEGLEYGFDLAKAVEVELVFEVMEELHLINEQRSSLALQLEEYERSESKEGDEEEEEHEDVSENEGVSESESQHLQLNEDEQHQLQKKMSNMNSFPDSDDSFYD